MMCPVECPLAGYPVVKSIAHELCTDPWNRSHRSEFPEVNSEYLNHGDATGGDDMLWIVLLGGAAVMTASYASEQAIVPKLHHRPGTPLAVVQSCREAVVSAARIHAGETGATLVRVDATSAGEVRPTRNGQSAPVEVGIVYGRSSGREARQGVIDCRVDHQGRVSIADLAGATP
jgi:hypothetical protein